MHAASENDHFKRNKHLHRVSCMCNAIDECHCHTGIHTNSLGAVDNGFGIAKCSAPKHSLRHIIIFTKQELISEIDRDISTDYQTDSVLC